MNFLNLSKNRLWDVFWLKGGDLSLGRVPPRGAMGSVGSLARARPVDLDNVLVGWWSLGSVEVYQVAGAHEFVVRGRVKFCEKKSPGYLCRGANGW